MNTTLPSSSPETIPIRVTDLLEVARMKMATEIEQHGKTDKCIRNAFLQHRFIVNLTKHSEEQRMKNKRRSGESQMPTEKMEATEKKVRNEQEIAQSAYHAVSSEGLMEQD